MSGIILQTWSWQIKPSFDSTIDGLFPLGDKSPTLTWNTTALPVLTNQRQGNSISFNARALLNGDGAALATISLVAVSGAGITGWTAAGTGNNCTNSGATIASGAFFLRAQYLGLTVDMPVQLLWSVVSANQGPLKAAPGFYLTLDPNQSVTQNLARMDALFANGANPGVVGVQYFMYWARLEGPSAPASLTAPGDYTGNWDSSGESGATAIRRLLAKCKQYGKMFMLNVQTAAYNAPTTTFANWLAPAYTSSSTYGPTAGNASQTSGATIGSLWFSSNTGNVGGYTETVQWWLPNVTLRINALAAGYGLLFDSDPNFYMYAGVGESAIPAPTYNINAALTFYNAHFQALNAAFPTSRRRWNGNYDGGTDAQTAQIIQMAGANRVSVGGPDTANETGLRARLFSINQVFRGNASGSATAGIVSGTTFQNEVGRIDFIGESQGASVGNGSNFSPAKFGTGIPADIVADLNLQGGGHMIFLDQNYTGPNIVRTQSSSNTAAPPSGGGPAHPNLLDFINASASNTPINGAVPAPIKNLGVPLLWQQAA